MAGFGVRYVGDTFDGGVTTPEFTLYDAMVGYGWDRYQVQLTGRNLADKTYLTSCSPFACYFGETRTIGLSLTATF
jgi:iron complex outermembrane receptor protein